MNTYPDKNTQMQAKLQSGLQTLGKAAESDRQLLGLALIQIHGAMEDFVRSELGRRAPQLRVEVEDVKQSSWRDLVIYSKQYLGFGEADADMILSANSQRNEFAHGGSINWSRNDVIRYAQYVHRKCLPGRPLPDLSYRIPAGTAEPEKSTSHTGPVKPPPPPGKRRSWTALTGILMLIVCLCGLAAAIFMFNNSLGSLQFGGETTETREPVSAQDQNERPSSSPEDTNIQPAELPGTDKACVIVWVEHSSERLAARNRSMVWEEFVMEQVRGSGMTDRQFYDEVVERNPQLKADGYEFKKGKTYLLPECE